MRFLRTLLLALLTTFLLALTAQALNFNVDCRVSGHLTINAAIAKIAARNPLGPNTITVTGNCHENVVVSSLDNLTLQAGPLGATISDASHGTLDTLVAVDAGRFALNGFTINGSVNCANNAVCRLFGNTIQNSQIGYGLRASRAHIDSQNDSISNNPSGVGVIVTNASRVVLVDDTISNNGSHGIQVFDDAFVFLANNATTTTVSNNGGFGVLATSQRKRATLGCQCDRQCLRRHPDYQRLRHAHGLRQSLREQHYGQWRRRSPCGRPVARLLRERRIDEYNRQSERHGCFLHRTILSHAQRRRHGWNHQLRRTSARRARKQVVRGGLMLLRRQLAI